MKELYDILVKEGVTPNGLFVLHCIKGKFSYANFVNMQTELYKLTVNGFIEVTGDDSFKQYNITKKGFDVLKKTSDFSSKEEPQKKPKVEFSEWQDQIVRYNTMFPKGKKPGTAMSFRTTPKELYDRFKWFFEEYPEYSWDDVFKATERYVSNFEEQNDYSYMQLSKYFIKKDDKNKSTTSTLAGICFNIAEGDDDDIDTGFHYFGP